MSEKMGETTSFRFTAADKAALAELRELLAREQIGTLGRVATIDVVRIAVREAIAHRAGATKKSGKKSS